MATLEDKISISPDVLVSEVENEAVLLNQKTGKYFTLDDVGTRIWKLVAQNGQLKPVFQALLIEYEVDPQRLEQDVLALVDQLAANDLLKINAA
jgi:hypothetical protein